MSTEWFLVKEPVTHLEIVDRVTVADLLVTVNDKAAG